ncbi:hypothetical protein ACFQS1_17185 [Paractinoplanes rhizophilus]|uniref:Pectate lyase n=1 Tax=Paractinoplanes rhizophilus TaxID=1416877 RepID=A0ABW2HRI1_9ACTN
MLALGLIGWVMSGDKETAASLEDSQATAGPQATASASGPYAPLSPSVSGSSAPSSPASANPSKTSPRPAKTEAAAAVSRARGSFPGAGNTGIPAGTKLKATSSSVLRIKKAGTVVNGVDIRADISVEADNVTIKNSRVITAGEWGIIQRENVKGLVVQDSEIRGNGKDRLQHAIFNLGGHITILRNDMSVVSDAISTSVGLIQDNYLHDPIYFDGDHTDMIQSNSGPGGGQQLVIRHNTVVNTLDQTAAIALFQDFGVQHDAIIENNLLAGGGYTLYGGAGTKGTSFNIKVTGNVFSREVHPKSGQYGPVAYWDKNGAGNVWQGNVWADTGQPVTP